MLCSISTPKSNSSWLDRLRSSKGFPITPDLESLDQFLSSNPNPNPIPIPKPLVKPPIDNNRNLFDLMSTVLADLFVMGSISPIPPNPQKSCRKQTNPRNCNVSGPLVGGKREVSPSSVSNSVAAAAAAAEGRKRKLKARKRRGCEGLANREVWPSSVNNSAAAAAEGSKRKLKARKRRGSEGLVNREVSPSSVNNSAAAAATATAAEGRKRKLKARKRRGSEGLAKDSDLLGFSRTEVTVIDTSLSLDWKAARVLYRKGLVWKVREKRVGRKKRRRVGLAEKRGGEKEQKGNNGDMRREQLALLDKGCAQTDKIEDSEETDDQILVPRRQKFSRSPRVPATKNYSCILKLLARNMGQPAQGIFSKEDVYVS